jgi:hypothetical protein
MARRRSVPGLRVGVVVSTAVLSACLVTIAASAAAARGQRSSSATARCKPDPAAAIAALPSGGVFVGSGCYLTSGIVVSKPVTIVGGTYDDPVAQRPRRGGVSPIIRVKDTSDVTIEDVALVGANVARGYHAPLVAAAGLDILSSSHVTIRHVSTTDTFGDGMTLFSEFGADSQPVSDLLVDGLVVKGAGRQGVTVGYVQHSLLDHVVVESAADTGLDFESDLAGVGSGNVVIANSLDVKGVHMIEALQGPITFVNFYAQQHITLANAAAQSRQQVTFLGGAFIMQRNTSTGVNRGGITVSGPGRLTIDHMRITRQAGSDRPSGPSISLTSGGHLTLIGSPLPRPIGRPDSSSVLTVEP